MEISSESDPLLKILEKAVSAIQAGDTEFRIDLDKLDLNIHLTGPKWAGIVDRPVAKFLLEFDRKITLELRNLGVDIPKNDHGIVGLEVKEGSMDAWVKPTQEFLNILKSMPLENQILWLAAILVGLGIYKFPTIIAAIKAPQAAVELETARGETQAKLLKGVEEIVAISRDLQAPLRSNLIDKMGSEDKIELPTSEEPMTKIQARQTLVKGSRAKPQSHYIDHVYIIQAINMKKSPWEVSLAYGEVSFPSKLILSTEDAQSLWGAFQEAHSQNSSIAKPLQVTARINGKKEIIDAEVVRIGTPRESSKKLSEILHDSDS